MTGAARPGTLVFIHLPKAGGMTLQSIVGRQYASRECFDINGEGADTVQQSVAFLRGLPPSKRDAIRCVRGHVPYGLGQWLRPPVTYITMLREPLARFISDYNFAMSVSEHAVKRQIGNRVISLEEFIDLRVAGGLTNLYTRMLSGCINWDDFQASPVPSQDMLEVAKQNLNGFAGVGLTERFDESVLLFQQALGWSNCWYLHENVTSKQFVDRHSLSADRLQHIRACINYDLELYAHAVRLFETRVSQAGSDFPRAVATFRQANAMRRGRLRVSRKLRQALRRAGNLLRMTVSTRGR
jgi:hypothetical protein